MASNREQAQDAMHIFPERKTVSRDLFLWYQTVANSGLIPKGPVHQVLNDASECTGVVNTTAHSIRDIVKAMRSVTLTTGVPFTVDGVSETFDAYLETGIQGLMRRIRVNKLGKLVKWVSLIISSDEDAAPNIYKNKSISAEFRPEKHLVLFRYTDASPDGTMSWLNQRQTLRDALIGDPQITKIVHKRKINGYFGPKHDRTHRPAKITGINGIVPQEALTQHLFISTDYLSMTAMQTEEYHFPIAVAQDDRLLTLRHVVSGVTPPRNIMKQLHPEPLIRKTKIETECGPQLAREGVGVIQQLSEMLDFSQLGALSRTGALTQPLVVV